MKEKLGFLLKTYRDDYLYAERLITSYKKHNVDNIPMFIMAPEDDLELFKKFKNKDIEILSEEKLKDYFIEDNSAFGIRPGFINQEVIKLAFWELGLCENYFCIDSDAEFIRDFYFNDFMFDADIPYSVLVEDNELVVDPQYYREHWVERSRLINIIKEELGIEDRRTLTCHGMTIFSGKVLKSFKEKYLSPKGHTYKDVLKKSPYEFSWYNFWLQKDKTIPIEFREPLLKVFHNKNHHLEYLKKNITIEDISRGYLGIVINSNYSRDFGIINYDTKKPYKINFLVKIFRKFERIIS